MASRVLRPVRTDLEGAERTATQAVLPPRLLEFVRDTCVPTPGARERILAQLRARLGLR